MGNSVGCTSQSMEIRPEQPDDVAAVRRVNEAAFGRPDEANLVDRLRERATTYLALVAVDGGDVIGHIAFSRITMRPPQPALSTLGLAPMAVLPARQRSGVGSALVRAGLAACRQAGADAVFVLGHPTYYPRFGFRPAATHGIGNEFGARRAAGFLLRLAHHERRQRHLSVEAPGVR